MDEFVVCPFDSQHRMLRKKLGPHIIKCKKLYPNVVLKTCPLNQLHLVRESEFVKHVSSCPDRKLITDYKFNGVVKEEKVVEKPQNAAHIEGDNEDWDDDIVNDFDPKKQNLNKNVLKQPDSFRPSERRLIIKEEEAEFEEQLNLPKPIMCEADIINAQNTPKKYKVEHNKKFNVKQEKQQHELAEPAQQHCPPLTRLPKAKFIYRSIGNASKRAINEEEQEELEVQYKFSKPKNQRRPLTPPPPTGINWKVNDTRD